VVVLEQLVLQVQLVLEGLLELMLQQRTQTRRQSAHRSWSDPVTSASTSSRPCTPMGARALPYRGRRP